METSFLFLLVLHCQRKPLLCPALKLGHQKKQGDLKHDLYWVGVTRFFFNFSPAWVFLRWISPGGLVYSALCLAIVEVNNGHYSSDLFLFFSLDSTVSFPSDKEQTSHCQGWEDAGPTALVLTTNISSSSLHPWVRPRKMGTPLDPGTSWKVCGHPRDHGKAFIANN